MAKGVHDTAFFIYNRFLALNEGRRTGEVRDRAGAFPQGERAARRAVCRHAMLATATHDTKRGEDARARLAASPKSRRYGGVRSQAGAGSCQQAGYVEVVRRPTARRILCFNAGWLVADGIARCADGRGAGGLSEPIQAALEKVLWEGKQRSSWAAADLEYEAAIHAFAREASARGRLPVELPAIRRAHGAARRAKQPRTDGDGADAPALPTSIRAAIVGPQPRRSGQSPRRRLPRAQRGAAELTPRFEGGQDRSRLFESAAAKLARRADQARCDRVSARFPARSPRAFRRGGYWPIETAEKMRTGRSASPGPPASVGPRCRPHGFPRGGKKAGLAGGRANARRRMDRSCSRTAFRRRCALARVVRPYAVRGPGVAMSDRLDPVRRRRLVASTPAPLPRGFLQGALNSKRHLAVTSMRRILNFRAGRSGSLVSMSRLPGIGLVTARQLEFDHIVMRVEHDYSVTSLPRRLMPVVCARPREACRNSASARCPRSCASFPSRWRRSRSRP